MADSFPAVRPKDTGLVTDVHPRLEVRLIKYDEIRRPRLDRCRVICLELREGWVGMGTVVHETVIRTSIVVWCGSPKALGCGPFP